MVGRRSAVQTLTQDLNFLASRCVADPQAYWEEFTEQRQQFQALASLVELDPTSRHERLGRLVAFLATVSGAYPAACRAVADWLSVLLKDRALALHPELRYVLVQALTRFRARDATQFVAAPDAVELYLQLLRCRDKSLRRLVSGNMLAELRQTRDKHRPLHEKIKTRLLQASQQILPDADPSTAKPIIRFFFMAYRRNLWRGDARLIQLLADTCFHANTGIAARACRFLLEADAVDQGSAESDRDAESLSSTSAEGDGATRANTLAGKSMKLPVDSSSVRMLNTRFKRTQKKSSRRKHRFQRQLRRTLQHDQAVDRVAEADAAESRLIVQPVLMMIYDPQAFTERLLNRLRERQEKFEFRLLVLQLACRCAGAHHLIVPPLYSVLQRYLTPSQREEKQILAMLVDAIHSEVPAELVTPILRHLAYYFVSDRRADEVVAVGLNTIRELCARVPEAMDPILLQDLVQYRKSRCRGIMMAARSVLQLYRRVKPTLLPRRERGRPLKASITGRDCAPGASNSTSSATSTLDETGDLVPGDEERSASETASSVSDVSATSWIDASSDVDARVLESPGRSDAIALASSSKGCVSKEEFAAERNATAAGSESAIPTGSACDGTGEGQYWKLQTQQNRFEAGLVSMKRSPEGASTSCGTRTEIDGVTQSAATDTISAHHLLEPSPEATQVRYEEPFRPMKPDRLESTFVRRRRTLEERLETVRRGRQDRPRYSGDPHRHHKKTGGLSNAEKAKRKQIAMMRPKIIREKQHRRRNKKIRR
jgi:protein SDA1